MTMTPEEREILRDHLARTSPSPFIDALTRYMARPPTEEAIQLWADKHPDKWAKAVSQLKGGAGYRAELAVEHRHLHLESLSDSELRDYIREQRKLTPLPILEVEYAELGRSIEEKREPSGPDHLKRQRLGKPFEGPKDE